MNMIRNSTFGCIITCLFLISLLSTSCKNNPGSKDEEHKFTNALINETSPYLLQHAHNPVDWRPWSEAAFEEAEKEGKLVIISVGYSSCHWCHVMEEETFVDEEVAKIMNENFISIKVDREERPDVDQVYMTAVQLMTGNSGWPMNVVVLPNGKPLYGGTYHTKAQWNQVLTELSTLYKKDPAKANEYAAMVAKGIQDENLITPVASSSSLSIEELKESVALWKQLWDLEWGGTLAEQKFMMPAGLDYLLDYASLTKDAETLEFVKITLDKIALGGVYDHIGGGFFRYSTDRFWKVPHFEKMLYDSAQLLELYSKAFKKFNDPLYKQVVLETAAFLDREMRHPEGAYYSSLDADSEGEEGKFYVWSTEELQKIMGADYLSFSNYFNVKEGESWEGHYILQRLKNDMEFASANGISIDEIEKKRQKWKQKLLETRQKRVAPNTDDKIITSWNALLIKGYVEAYEAFDEDSYLSKAEGIFNFLKDKSYKDGRLLHSFKKGDKGAKSFLEDYTYLVDASLHLYSATLKEGYLTFAQNLHNTAVKTFEDEASGMFRYSTEEDLIATIIKIDDGVLPSPNAVMAHNLFQFGHIEYNTESLEKAAAMLSAIIPALKERPYSYAYWGGQYLRQANPYYEIAVVGPKAPALVKELHTKYLPNTLIVGTSEQSDLPLFEARYIDGETFIYVCKNNACKLPVQTTEDALEQMKNF